MEYRCGIAICLWLEPRSGVRVRVVTRVSVWVMVRFNFAVVLLSFSQFYAFCIAQMRNGNCIRVRVRGLGLRSGLRLALASGSYFYFVEVLCCFRYFTHSTPIFCSSTLYPAGGTSRQTTFTVSTPDLL